MRHRRNMCNSPSSGGSQLTLASQWESRKVMTSPLAAEAPSRRVLMRPSLFLVLRIRTFGIRFMYSSSGTFRCSVDSTDRQIVSITRYKYSGFSPHTNDCKQSAFNSASLTHIQTLMQTKNLLIRLPQEPSHPGRVSTGHVALLWVFQAMDGCLWHWQKGFLFERSIHWWQIYEIRQPATELAFYTSLQDSSLPAFWRFDLLSHPNYQ